MLLCSIRRPANKRLCVTSPVMSTNVRVTFIFRWPFSFFLTRFPLGVSFFGVIFVHHFWKALPSVKYRIITRILVLFGNLYPAHPAHTVRNRSPLWIASTAVSKSNLLMVISHFNKGQSSAFLNYWTDVRHSTNCQYRMCTSVPIRSTFKLVLEYFSIQS